MKNILLSLFIFMVSISSYAQDPQLFENDWYLQELIIDEETYLPPSNDEVSNVPLNFYESLNRLETVVCSNLAGEPISFDGNNPTFTVETFFQTKVICAMQENVVFSGLYYNNFFKWQETDNTYEYEIVESEDYLTLILNNEDGNIAIYRNELLLSPGFKNPQISIFPNPVNEILYIECKSVIIINVTVYNVLGEVFLRKEGNATQMKTSKLPKGVFFMKIDTDKGSLTRKVIKQ